ncbi:MAG: 16S rRNA (adenine(1518)-N(6)/adenine(1519)-N(6))-dimethyltransferase RsmA [Firmicutes bacterium]|jgi:16S rRNA (adenine1518-N6/adenine1519-N6)-dimethyltransferase|nr:16S rRNA (adenine(1518)-N(6)/adenine(1519)-N(6))-dimethyltransferase RsmA [Bacillota bacterium]
MGAKTKEQLRQHNIKAKKRLGQNFLLDKRILARLADAAELSKSDIVLEIGPGSGNLTVELAQRSGAVIAVEADQELEPVLTANLAEFNNVQLIWGDFLEQDLDTLWQLAPSESVRQRKVVANLPYYITSPVLVKLLTAGQPPNLAVILVQLEVAQRLVAKPGTKDYGSLSVLTQFYACPELVLKVPPAAFFPRPKVWSAAVRLKFRDQPAVDVGDKDFFFQVVRASFGHRRKTLANSLQHDLGDRLTKQDITASLIRAGIDPMRRGETLSLKEFAKLTTALTEQQR